MVYLATFKKVEEPKAIANDNVSYVNLNNLKSQKPIEVEATPIGRSETSLSKTERKYF